jgi:prepilin-type N-terminal cleavage/methylation domain-containing protein
MAQQRAARGFTIIELLIVVVLAGVLLVLALPSFNDLMARHSVQGQADELVADLTFAKSEAVQRNRNVMLRTDPTDTRCYTIAVWTSGVGDCDCTAAPRCTGGPIELKTVVLRDAAAVTSNVVFDFEPVRGALQPPAVAASAAVSLASRSYAVAVAANGRITPPTP